MGRIAPKARPDRAPLFTDLAQGPDQGAAYWLRTTDGLRIRAAVWADRAAKGTVILLPGRTEYVEKYGHVAQKLALQGLNTVAVDWRGQGLSDRLLVNHLVGHVGDFTDYQLDLAAVLSLADRLELAQPYFLMAHSMGGAIGLRALCQPQARFQAVVFSAPMWGIAMSPALRPVAGGVSQAAQWLRQGHRMVPNLPLSNLRPSTQFKGNRLTTDPEMWNVMKSQLQAQPQLALSRPSLNWLQAALRECQALAKLPSPAIPCLTLLGSNEKIVAPRAIHQRMAHWPQGRLELLRGAEHEVPMEALPHRQRFYDLAVGLYLEALTQR